jgi:Family of unknown function (DUF6353)
MTLHNILVKAGKIVVSNSPAILTVVGVTGTITTAYLAGRASFQVSEILSRERKAREIKNQRAGELQYPDPDFKENVKRVWQLYIPTAVSGVATISAIVVSNRIGSRRTAAIASAFALSEKAWDEYKDKVVEKIGTNKERVIRDEIAQDRIDSHPLSDRKVIITGTGDHLCYDAVTDRYFQSSMETLRKAQNDINAQILENNYASLADFFVCLGLRPTPGSYDVGWNRDKLLEIEYTAVLGDDGKPCMSFNYTVQPIRDFHRLQ